MTSDARLVKVEDMADPDNPEHLLWNTWTQVLANPDDLLFEQVDATGFEEADELITVLEGRADINYL